MATQHTKANGQQTANGDIPVVAPINMGKGIKWNDKTKTYEVNIADNQPIGLNELGELEVRISELESNQLRLLDGKFYYGPEPEEKFKNQYVDYLNGNDSNLGTKESPLKTIGKALKNIKLGTVGSYIFIKEGQNHYLSDNLDNWNHPVKGSVSISPYGENRDRLSRQWFDMSKGYKTAEPVEASEEFEPYRPKIIMRSSLNAIISNSATKERYNHSFNIFQGVTLGIVGVEFTHEYQENASQGVWFNTVVRGKGIFECTACTMDNTPKSKKMWLANSTVGGISVNLRYFKLKGNEPFLACSQFVMNVNMSYIVTQRTLQALAVPEMYYRAGASVAEMKALVHNANQFNPIYNQ